MALVPPSSHTGGLGNVTLSGTAAASQVPTASSASAATWQYPPGYEIAYVEFATSTTVSATTSATAQAIVSAGAITFDGTACLIEYFGPFHSCAATATLNVDLYLDGSFVSNGIIGILTFTTAGTAPLCIRRKVTPSAGSHTYEIRMHRGTANWTVDATAGGGLQPGYIRITKV